jgi:hypothetical protein
VCSVWFSQYTATVSPNNPEELCSGNDIIHERWVGHVVKKGNKKCIEKGKAIPIIGLGGP